MDTARDGLILDGLVLDKAQFVPMTPTHLADDNSKRRRIGDDAESGEQWGRSEGFYSKPSQYYEMRFVHGSNIRNLDSILERGLVARTTDVAICDKYSKDVVIPGIDSAPEILIILDKNKLLAEGISMTKGEEDGTYTTMGQVKKDGRWVPNMDGEAQGTIRPWFFRKIIDNRPGKSKGNVLFLSKDAWSAGWGTKAFNGHKVKPTWLAGQEKAIKEARDTGARSASEDRHTPQELPDQLIHATSMVNLKGIFDRGIIPHGADNPNSSGRNDHMPLLKGAEGHVNAVLPPTDGRTCIEVAGLEKSPDVLVTIDVKKAREMGVGVMQSRDRPDHFFFQGALPPECLVGVHANMTAKIPRHLQAKVVSPNASFQTLPIIDLRLDEKTLVEQMRFACCVPGFFQVIGHDVPESLETNFLANQKKFFALPLEKKEALKVSDDSPVRGWFGRGAENLDGVLLGEAAQNRMKRKNDEVQRPEGRGNTKPKLTDNKEGFDCNGVPWSQPGDGEVARVFGLPSQFPKDDVPGMQDTVEGLSKHLFDLARKLLRLMALALDLKENFFEEVLTRPVATMRMLHYWPLKGDFKNQIGIGEHTDYGLLTILKQDDVGGLQVLSALDMQWVLVPPTNGAYVVNLGDMMSIWTNDYFKSTIHRVVNISPSDRYSSPLFLEPNLDSVIEKGALAPKVPNRTSGEILEGFYVAAGLLKPRSQRSPAKGS